MWAEQLTEALVGGAEPPGPVTEATPDTYREVIGYTGATTPAGAARALHGYGPRERLPQRGSDARRSYEADKRSLERYRKWAEDLPGERRAPNLKTIEQLRRRAVNARSGQLIARCRRRGARTRIRAVVVVETPSGARAATTRERTMPVGGPGVELSPADMQNITDLFLAGDTDAAGDAFIESFFERYEWPDAEVVSVTWTKIWPADQPEP